VVHKCGFDYMQEHQDNFEMHPPHILQSRAELFVSGSADRHKDVPNEMRDRLRSWAARGLSAIDLPIETAYPDLAAARDKLTPTLARPA
jgi:hypothetical protein